MSNSYQQKFNELESGSAAIKKKLDDTLNYRESIKQNQPYKDYFTR